MLEHALRYFAQGIKVIPLKPRDKWPLVPWKGVEITEERIREWWGQWPDANIGILLSESDLLVIDIDNKEGFEEVKKLGFDTDTWLSQSGKGFHLYYRHDGLKSRATKCGDSRGIDVLAAGYVIAPPSVHPSGRVYEWLDQEHLKPAPSWAIRHLERVEAETIDIGALPEVTLDDLRVPDKAKKLIVEGTSDEYPSRSEAVFAAIRYLLNAGHTNEEIAAVLLNEEWAIGERVRERTDSLYYIKGEIGRARAKGTKPVLDDGRDVLLDREGVLALLRDDPTEWLIEGVLPTGMLCVLGAYAKSGKSTMALHVAKALLQGRPFLGHNAKRSPVVYVNFEMHLDTWAKMCTDIFGAETEWPVLVHRPTSPTKHEILCRYVERLGTSQKGLLIIDAARKAFALEGEEENWAGSMGMKVREIADVARDTGWAVLLIHHSSRRYFHGNISISDLSGTGDVAAAADVIWIWRANEDQTKPGQLLMDGRVHKKALYDVLLSREHCERVDGEAQIPTRYLVLEALAKVEEGLSTGEIVDLTGLPPRTVRYHLAKLVEEGAAERLGTANSPTVKYRLATKEGEHGKGV